MNNHINSSIRDCLHIRGTIFDSEERVVSTRNVTYSDDPIIFIPIPSGKYTCSIDIITTSKLTFDSRRIPCATKAPSQLFLIVTISLSASTLVALLLGFTIGLLVLRCWITRKERTRRESKRLPEKLSSNSTKVPDPHYEELPKPNRNSIPLESNIAYGNTPYGNSLGRHSLAVSHSSETQTLV